MSITKTDVLNTVIKITRDTGQGLTGIVSLNSPEYAKYLDILEKEGKIEKYTIYNNYLANDIWYLPKGIYSVWSDKNYMKSLSYIRKYLKIESLNDVKGVLDNKEFNNYVSEYNNWINEHKEKLKEIINLKTTDEDLSSDEHDSDIDINFEVFKSRKWYKNNFSLRECIYELHKNISINQRIINLYSELIKINNTLKPEDVEKNKEDKKQTEQELKLEEEFVKLLYSFDENEKIQNILK